MLFNYSFYKYLTLVKFITLERIEIEISIFKHLYFVLMQALILNHMIKSLVFIISCLPLCCVIGAGEGRDVDVKLPDYLNNLITSTVELRGSRSKVRGPWTQEGPQKLFLMQITKFQLILSFGSVVN